MTVTVSPSTVTHVSTLVEDADNGEGYSRAGVQGETPYLPLNFVMNLKLLFKNKSVRKS